MLCMFADMLSFNTTFFPRNSNSNGKSTCQDRRNRIAVDIETNEAFPDRETNPTDFDKLEGYNSNRPGRKKLGRWNQDGTFIRPGWNAPAFTLRLTPAYALSGSSVVRSRTGTSWPFRSRSGTSRSAVRARKWRRLARGRFGFIALYR